MSKNWEAEMRDRRLEYGPRRAKPAEVLRLINQGRKVLKLEPLKAMLKGSDPLAFHFDPLVRSFPGYKLGYDVTMMCKHCHCLPDALFWTTSKRQANALAKVWGTTAASETVDGAVVLLLPLALNQFSAEYNLGLWPEYVDREIISLHQDGLDEKIAAALGIVRKDLAKLPGVIVDGDMIVDDDDSYFMRRKDVAKYLLPASLLKAA